MRARSKTRRRPTMPENAGSVGAVALAAALAGLRTDRPLRQESSSAPHFTETARRDVGSPTGTTMTVSIPTPVSTSTHSRGQAFFAALKDPLIVGSETVATSGALVEGQVQEAERGGRFKGRAQLVVRLTRLHTERGVIGITSESLSQQGGSGFLKRGSPAVLRAGTVLRFHTISNGGHN
jgi:hypothetical protein